MFFGQTLRNSLFLCSLCQKTKASIFPMQKHIHTIFFKKDKQKDIATGTKDPGHCESLTRSTTLIQSRSLKKTLNSWSNFSLVWFHINNKYKHQIWQIDVTISTNSCYKSCINKMAFFCFGFNNIFFCSGIKTMFFYQHQQHGFCFVLASTTKTTSPWNTQQQHKSLHMPGWHQ